MCTNTWQPQSPAPWTGVTWGGPAVVYDPGTDVILALTVNETHATRVSEYSPATDEWTETTVPQRLLPWAYPVDSDAWALLPTIEFPPGFESAAVTHAALDAATGEVLFLMEDAGSLNFCSPSPAWKTLTKYGRSGTRRPIRRSHTHPRPQGPSRGADPVGLRRRHPR